MFKKNSNHQFQYDIKQNITIKQKKLIIINRSVSISEKNEHILIQQI
jgi:hypothetical protein